MDTGAPRFAAAGATFARLPRRDSIPRHDEPLTVQAQRAWNRRDSSAGAGGQPLSSRTPTSRCRCAAAGRRAPARGSRPGAGPAASGTHVVLRRRSPLGAQPPSGPDRVGGGAEFVGGHVCDGSRLAGGVRGIPRRPAQGPGRAHRVAARRSGLHHRDLAPHPTADVLDRLAWSSVRGPSRLEQGEDVLGARRRPQGEQVVVGVGEGAAATDRHEARIADLREDHGASTGSRQRRALRRCGSRSAMSWSSSLGSRLSYAGAARSSVSDLDPLLGLPAGVAEPAGGVDEAAGAHPVHDRGQLGRGEVVDPAELLRGHALGERVQHVGLRPADALARPGRRCDRPRGARGAGWPRARAGPRAPRGRGAPGARRT